MDTRNRTKGRSDPYLLRPPIKSSKNDGTKSDESTKAQHPEEKETESTRMTETTQSRNAKIPLTKDNEHGDKADESDDSESNDSETEITKEMIKPSSHTFYRQYSSKGNSSRKEEVTAGGAGDKKSSLSLKPHQTSTPNTADFGNSVNYRTTRIFSYSDGEEEKKTSSRQQKDTTSNQRRITRKLVSSASEEEEETREVSGSSLSSVMNKIGALLLCLIVAAVAYLALKLLILTKPDTSKAEEFRILQDFHDGFRKLPIMYTNQSQELWRRSGRILELHLKSMKENQAPAIILLTAAQDGEHMLHCIGNKLAKTYASSQSSNYTEISGPDRRSEDSEDVKFEIDKKLSDGFNATASAAVLHRLELLPPGSLLILYKYCDHENAHFKNVALVLTVLLEDPTLTHDIPLNDLEEKVREFFNEKFIEPDTIKSHNRMDMDKLSGVWSRISHVVLPVYPEGHVEESCE